jgi:molybdopterin-binding protein
MANPTTNYGFVLPTSTDLVTDLPADFDVALQGVDTRLKALQPGTTLGDLAYSSATANTNTRLGVGSTGQVLTVAGGVPTWATPAGGSGTIKQVVVGSTSTQVTTTSSTQTDTGLTATITPTSASSKILVMTSQNYSAYLNSGGQLGNVSSLLRDSTVIVPETSVIFGVYAAGSGGGELRMMVQTGFIQYDQPATTSAVTYKTQFAQRNGVTALVQQGGTSYITLIEIGG